ncbi:MAG: hypothetical protein ACM3NQ_05000 [Bacteroidales bacterium]
MTTHLTNARLVELAEGGGSHPHLADCERCRARVAELRGVIESASGVGVPEPSPLFWDHFAARVAAKIELEAGQNASRFAMWRRVAAWRRVALIAASMLVLAGVVTWRSGVLAPEQPPPAHRVAAVGTGLPADADGDMSDDDETWALVTQAASALDLEAASDAGFELQPGAAETAAAQLSPDERHELVRLLKAAVSHPGS